MKRKYIHFLGLILLLFTFEQTLFAQTHYFENYSVKDGLAQSKVYQVLQDKNAYLWLGTASGVSRFDGLSFENFTNEDGLAESGVKCMCEDSQGNIWFGHVAGGVSRFDGKKFEQISFDSLNINKSISAIVENDKGEIWISTAGNGAILIQNNKSNRIQLSDYKYFTGKQGLSDRVYSVLVGSDGTSYFLIDGSIKYYIPETDSFDFLHLEGLPKYFQITCMFEDNQQNLWFGTYNGGLYTYNNQQKKFKIYDVRDGLAHNWISYITQDSAGAMWIGTWEGGITVIDGKKLTIFNKSNGLNDNVIRCILEDREGNMIIGTNSNGFSIYKGDKFVKYATEDGIAGQQVSAILQDHLGRFWFGTDAGITLFNPKASEKNKIKNFTMNEGLLSHDILAIKQDKENGIWVACENGGVVKYNPRTNYFEYIPRINTNRYIHTLRSFEIDKDMNVWVGTEEGIVYYEIKNNAYDVIRQTYGLASNLISALFSDSKGILWVGSDKGLTTINKNKFANIKIDTSLVNIGDYTPICMAEDQSGKVWIGTQAQGLLLCENGKIVRQLTVKDGLLADYITLLSVDNQNDIWIGTSRGLNKFSQKDSLIFTYTEKMGFMGIEAKENAVFKDKLGNIWFGTVKGVMKMNTSFEKRKKVEPLTRITRFRVNLKNREMTPNLELAHDEKSIHFDYGSIFLTNPTGVSYKVMLQGADLDWLPESKQRDINYPFLPPNKYTFKLLTKTEGGTWNPEPITYSFVILPPIWQRWWFILSLFIALSAVVILYINIREQNLQREKHILEEKVQERTAEVVQKNTELADKNQAITDSIRYAKRIQDAILPDNEHIKELIDEYFILFKPRDIVSGDYYWMTEQNNTVIIAAVDCTGHGVPGAFMSMLGIAFLNEIVNKKEDIKANEILNELREYVISSLKQRGKKMEAQDGMDMALCIIDFKKKELQFAGANNPLYLIRKGGEITEIRGDKMPIGIYYRKEESFTNHNLKFEKGDSFYIFTDGLVDQFGGPKERKFMKKRFKELLLTHQDKTMEEQKAILNNAVETWRGDLHQVDDMLVIGCKL